MSRMHGHTSPPDQSALGQAVGSATTFGLLISPPQQIYYEACPVCGNRQPTGGSYRVQTTLTGLSPPTAFATAAASPATSPLGVARRPKLPPASILWARTFAGGRPTMVATTCWSTVGI